MLERLNIFVGSLVLSVLIVFGAMYAAVGDWKTEDLGIKTASTAEQAPQQQSPAAPAQ
jgi:hypothetical protein